MLKETTPGIYQSELLSRYEIPHGFSSRSLGDMRTVEPRQRLKKMLGLSQYRLVAAEQVHGSTVHVVTPDDFGKTVLGADGLVYRYGETPANIALGIIAADCAPMLFADIQAGVIGATHAGWKGTLGRIATKTIEHMMKLGSSKSEIIVTIGPHIGMCHYNVPEERAQKFLEMFHGEQSVASNIQGSWHIDIGWANYQQLIDFGVLPEHIDAPPVCTVCQIDRFFSFRGDTKETYGEIMGVIGFGKSI